MTWHDLSDDELEARIRQRGVPAENAEAVVAERDALGAVISMLLDEDD